MNKSLLVLLTLSTVTTTQIMSMETDEIEARSSFNWGCDHREYLRTQHHQDDGDDSSYKQMGNKYTYHHDENEQPNKRRRTLITTQNVDATVARYIEKQKQHEAQKRMMEKLAELNQLSSSILSYSFTEKSKKQITPNNRRTKPISQKSRTLSVSSTNSTDSETNSDLESTTSSGKGLITAYFKKTKKAS